MKQMNKEELINYFIEQLGDNHVLGKCLSIEEIRQRLNENIEQVTYVHEKGNNGGSYNKETKIINICIDKGYPDSILREIIVHELLHILSYSRYDSPDILTTKIGFEIVQESKTGPFSYDTNWGYYAKGMARLFGKGINEGITQLLTEEILGLNTNFDIGYQEEKDITRVFLGMFGKEAMLKKYFQKVRSEDELTDPLKYLFAEVVEKNSNILDTLRSVFGNFESLAIMKFNSAGELDEDQKKAYNQIKGKVCNDIKKLVEIYLKSSKKDDDLQNKVEQILMSFQQFHDKRINFLYGNVKLHLNTVQLANAIQNIIFNKMDSHIGSIVSLYFRLTAPKSFDIFANGAFYQEWKNSVEEYCIKHGIVNQQDFSKSGMLSLILKHSNNLDTISDSEFRNILSNYSYKKVGSHYELLYHGVDPILMGGTHTSWFNEDGTYSWLNENGTYPKPYVFFPEYDEWGLNGSASSEIEEKRVEQMRIQLKKISDNSDKKLIRAMVLGNDMIMYFHGEKQWADENRIVYTLDNEGNIVQAQEEMPRRLSDDMSELDIRLMQETARAGITVSDMKNVAQIMKLNRDEKANESIAEDRGEC